MLKALKTKYSFIGGADISWSRVKVGQNFVKHADFSDKGKINLFIGDLFNLPLKNNSIDVVYTVHSLEPNGGHELELLKELYRITRKYLILLEPAYELADEKSKKRMEKHGYIKGLPNAAKSLGLNIIRYELFGLSANPLNPTGLMIIKKDINNLVEENPICCPVTKTDLYIKGNSYYSDESLLAYPIINGVACLTKENAIVATKMDILE